MGRYFQPWWPPAEARCFSGFFSSLFRWHQAGMQPPHIIIGSIAFDLSHSHLLSALPETSPRLFLPFTFDFLLSTHFEQLLWCPIISAPLRLFRVKLLHPRGVHNGKYKIHLVFTASRYLQDIAMRHCWRFPCIPSTASLDRTTTYKL